MPIKISAMKLRLLRWTVPVLAVFGVVISQFNESGRQYLLERFDVRWYLELTDDKQLVGLSNTGKDKLQGVQVQIALPESLMRPVVDLECGQFAQGNLKSFIKTLLPIWQEKLSKRLEPGEELPKMKNALLQRTLYGLDQFFTELRLRRLQKLTTKDKKPLITQTKVSEVEAEIHEMQREVHGPICEEWKKATGVEVEFKTFDPILPGSYQSLNFSTGLASLNFITSIDGEDTKFLYITYGPERLNPITKLQLSSGKRINKVTISEDLVTNDLLMFIKYDPLLSMLFLSLFVAISLAGWLARRPLATHVLMNFALRTKDRTELDKALEQHGDFILYHFQQTCWAAKRDPGQVADKEILFIHVRFWLEKRYSGKRNVFVDDKALETSLRKFIVNLVSKLPHKETP